MFKTNISGHNKICGALSPNATQWLPEWDGSAPPFPAFWTLEIDTASNARFVAVLLLRNRDQQQNNHLAIFATSSAGKGAGMSELQARRCVIQSCEPGSCTVWVSCRQINCHCKN